MSEEMNKSEIQQAVEMAVAKSEIAALAMSFSEHVSKEDTYLKEIFDKLRKVQEDISKWPLQIEKCSSDLEQDILSKIEATYMTKKDGQLLEQHLINSVRSIKLWIVSTVGGFTTAGVLIAWYLKVFG